METKSAYAMIRALGKVFETALTDKGYSKPATTILMAGIAAYNKLNLKGCPQSPPKGSQETQEAPKKPEEALNRPA